MGFYTARYWWCHAISIEGFCRFCTLMMASSAVILYGALKYVHSQSQEPHSATCNEWCTISTAWVVIMFVFLGVQTLGRIIKFTALSMHSPPVRVWISMVHLCSVLVSFQVNVMPLAQLMYWRFVTFAHLQPDNILATFADSFYYSIYLAILTHDVVVASCLHYVAYKRSRRSHDGAFNELMEVLPVNRTIEEVREEMKCSPSLVMCTVPCTHSLPVCDQCHVPLWTEFCALVDNVGGQTSWRTNEEESCAMCLEKLLGTHQSIVCLATCGHVFHTQCIAEWCTRKANCPLCRTTGFLK